MRFPSLPPLPSASLRTPMPTASPLESRRAAVGRIDAMGAKVHRVQGFLTVDGAGEAAVEVAFPVWFIERPLCTFGGEMAENESPEAGGFPTVSVVVLAWAFQDYPGGVRYYSGARLAVVTTGRDGHQMLVHWQAEGKALRNPVGDTGTTDSTI